MSVTVAATKALLAIALSCGSAGPESAPYTVCAVKAYHGIVDTVDACSSEMIRKSAEDGAFYLREGLVDVNATGVCDVGELTPEELLGIEQMARDSYGADKVKTRHYRVLSSGDFVPFNPEGFPK